MKSKYTPLWLLLAAALLLITAISFLDDFAVFGVKIKKAPIAERLMASQADSAAVRQQEMAAEIKAKPQENPVDSAPQSFLIFGDSMSQNLALRLAAYARQNGHTIHTVNWDSSGTRIWSKTDTLDKYIKEYRPTFIFVSLGGNESGTKHPEGVRPNVEALLQKIGDIPFVWIGPPSLREPDHGFMDMLAATLPAGTFFRSDGLELERRRDRIHPTQKAAAYQVDSLARWIRHSAHPILMDTPADSVAQTTLRDINIIYLKPRH